MLLGRGGTQSCVYKVNKNSELTNHFGALVFVTSAPECELLTLTSCLVSEKRVVSSYQCGVDFCKLHFAMENGWLNCSGGRNVVCKQNTAIGL